MVVKMMMLGFGGIHRLERIELFRISARPEFQVFERVEFIAPVYIG